MSLLDVTDLTVRYGDDTVVDGVDIFIERGESVGLVGESGSGKSQTAQAILGLLPHHAVISGSIEFDGQQLLGASEAELNRVRARRIGMVFQDPMLALNPYLRIGDQLAQILIAHDEAQDVDARVIDMLGRVGLPDPARQARSWPHELSGGMRQRAMIAAALIAQPDLLIADEPTTALDVTVQAQILELLETLRDDTALLLISHDLGVIAGHCEHMIVLERGRPVEAGRTQSVFKGPKHPHTRALLAAAPRIDRDAAPAVVEGRVLLTADAVNIRYNAGRKDELVAVNDVALSVRRGETLGIVGESGSGKSSLVRAILGLQPQHSGRVHYDGTPLAVDVRQRPLDQRRDLQLVFQDPIAALNPQHRISDIVAEPLQVHQPQLPAKEREQRVAAMLDKVGLDDSLGRRYPHQLSGGQAQRVAIARALLLQPKILFCDEAVAALDGTVRKSVLELLRSIQAETGLAIVFVSHDLAVVRGFCHRVVVMYQGRIVEQADNEALFTAPRDAYTRALLRAVPIPDPTAARTYPSE